MEDTNICSFGMVHSERTVVVLLHSHFSSWLSTFCNSVSIIMNCTYTSMSKSNITAYVNSLITFFIITSNFSSLPTVFCLFFTWIALGNVDWYFSLLLVTKTNAVEGGPTSSIHHQHKETVHLTVGVTVKSLLLDYNTRQVLPWFIYAPLH